MSSYSGMTPVDQAISSMTDDQFHEFLHGKRDPIYNEIPFQFWRGKPGSALRTVAINNYVKEMGIMDGHYRTSRSRIKAVVKQVKESDEEIKAFHQTVADFAKLLGPLAVSPTKFKQNQILEMIHRYFRKFTEPWPVYFELPFLIVQKHVTIGFHKQMWRKREMAARIKTAIENGLVDAYFDGDVLAFLEKHFAKRSPTRKKIPFRDSLDYPSAIIKYTFDILTRTDTRAGEARDFEDGFRLLSEDIDRVSPNETVRLIWLYFSPPTVDPTQVREDTKESDVMTLVSQAIVKKERERERDAYVIRDGLANGDGEPTFTGKLLEFISNHFYLRKERDVHAHSDECRRSLRWRDAITHSPSSRGERETSDHPNPTPARNLDRMRGSIVPF